VRGVGQKRENHVGSRNSRGGRQIHQRERKCGKLGGDKGMKREENLVRGTSEERLKWPRSSTKVKPWRRLLAGYFQRGLPGTGKKGPGERGSPEKGNY